MESVVEMFFSCAPYKDIDPLSITCIRVMGVYVLTGFDVLHVRVCAAAEGVM